MSFCYRKLINVRVVTVTRLGVDYFSLTAQHRVFDSLLNDEHLILAQLVVTYVSYVVVSIVLN